MTWNDRRDDWLKRVPNPENHRAVIYRKVRCPVCDSKRCPIYCTKIPIRYHRCEHCGHRFKSVEED